jgi:hypothetical protein
MSLLGLIAPFALLLAPTMLPAQPLPIPSSLLQNVDVAPAYAELDEETARKLIRGCSVPKEIRGVGVAGSQTMLQFTVSEKGKLLNVRRVQGTLTHQLSAEFANCHFAAYKVNGTPTAFQANMTIDVK